MSRKSVEINLFPDPFAPRLLGISLSLPVSKILTADIGERALAFFSQLKPGICLQGNSPQYRLPIPDPGNFHNQSQECRVNSPVAPLNGFY